VFQALAFKPFTRRRTMPQAKRSLSYKIIKDRKEVRESITKCALKGVFIIFYLSIFLSLTP